MPDALKMFHMADLPRNCTTNLVTHLKKHPDNHKEYETKKATYNEILAVEVMGASSGSGKQLTLSESYDHSQTIEGPNEFISK